MEEVLSICCLLFFCLGAILAGAIVFKKDVCKKVPKFPFLCAALGSGGGGGGNFGNTGTAVNGTSGKTNISFFGQDAADDNGVGFVGVSLANHGNAGIKFQNRPVYPAAVFMGNGAAFLYKVLEVKGANIKPILVHIVDLCDSSQAVCKKNSGLNGLNFLVDIHKTGFAASGNTKGDGLTTGEYKVVGEIRPRQMPKSVWMPKVAANKDSIVCSCKGGCTEKEATWKLLSQCS